MPRNFIKYKESPLWFMIDTHTRTGELISRNFKGGFNYIDENSNEYMEAVVIEADSWADLFAKTGFDPTQLEDFQPNMWIAPDGTMHEGDGHSVIAEDIAEIWYDWNEDSDQYSAEYRLEYMGWIKVSRDFWDMHLDTYSPWNPWCMNPDQARVVKAWCNYYKIDYPKDVIREAWWK